MGGPSTDKSAYDGLSRIPPEVRDGSFSGPSRSWLDELYAYVRRATRPRIGEHIRNELTNIVQSVVVVVTSKIDGFESRGAGSFRSWVRVIIKRKLARVARRERLRQHAVVEAARVPGDGLDSPVKQAIKKEELGKLGAAVGTLKDKERQLYVMSVLNQMSLPEIAERTGEPYQTVYSRREKMMRNLREQLGGNLLEQLGGDDE